MHLRYGNMWSAFSDADFFVITTNSFVKANGAAVLGRGIARQARDRFPAFDLRLGLCISDSVGHLGRYGLIVGRKLGAFQVKYHFRDRADPGLIAYSASKLVEFATARPDQQIHLNYPGIGNGGLPRPVVAPLLDDLPDNVHVWQYRVWP